MRRVVVIALAVLASILVSTELALSLPILGAGPDVLVLTIVAVAAGERPQAATVTAFAVGLVRDLLLSTPKGISAFAYSVTAYAVTLAGPVRGVWAFIALSTGATAASQALYGFGMLVLTPSASLQSLPRIALGTIAYNALLAPLLLPVLRRFVAAPETVSGSGIA